MKKIFLSIFLCVYVFCLQNINAGKNNSRTIPTPNKTKDEKKPFKRKDVFSFEDKKNIKTFKADNSKIKAQRELLIRDLKSSLIYLNNLFKTIQPIAKNYQDKADGNLIASELAVFCGDIKTTETFINNCIIFLTVRIDSLASFSAEDMADWINKINTHLQDLNERNILSINIENHNVQIKENAKKLQTLL